MPLSFRPALLLSAALLGVAGAAVGAPQHRREPPPPRSEEPREPPQQRRMPERPRFERSEPRPDPESSRRPRRGEDALSDSIRRVEQRTRGQVLSAERVPYDGRNLNRIKVVDERGRVRVYMDDPQAGAQAGDPGTPTRDNDD